MGSRPAASLSSPTRTGHPQLSRPLAFLPSLFTSACVPGSAIKKVTFCSAGRKPVDSIKAQPALNGRSAPSEHLLSGRERRARGAQDPPHPCVLPVGDRPCRHRAQMCPSLAPWPRSSSPCCKPAAHRGCRQCPACSRAGAAHRGHGPVHRGKVLQRKQGTASDISPQQCAGSCKKAAQAPA